MTLLKFDDSRWAHLHKSRHPEATDTSVPPPGGPRRNGSNKRRPSQSSTSENNTTPTSANPEPVPDTHQPEQLSKPDLKDPKTFYPRNVHKVSTADIHNRIVELQGEVRELQEVLNQRLRDIGGVTRLGQRQRETVVPLQAEWKDRIDETSQPKVSKGHRPGYLDP